MLQPARDVVIVTVPVIYTPVANPLNKINNCNRPNTDVLSQSCIYVACTTCTMHYVYLSDGPTIHEAIIMD